MDASLVSEINCYEQDKLSESPESPRLPEIPTQPIIFQLVEKICGKKCTFFEHNDVHNNICFKPIHAFGDTQVIVGKTGFKITTTVPINHPDQTTIKTIHPHQAITREIGCIFSDVIAVSKLVSHPTLLLDNFLFSLAWKVSPLCKENLRPQQCAIVKFNNTLHSDFLIFGCEKSVKMINYKSNATNVLSNKKLLKLIVKSDSNSSATFALCTSKNKIHTYHCATKPIKSTIREFDIVFKSTDNEIVSFVICCFCYNDQIETQFLNFYKNITICLEKRTNDMNSLLGI